MFEHVDPSATQSTAPSTMKLKQQQQVQSAQLLVCETSKELRNYSELFVEALQLGADGMPLEDTAGAAEDGGGWVKVGGWCRVDAVL